MYLYLFCDAVTGEMQQPILAHNDGEAIRIAQMAFDNVPHRILDDLYLARVKSYECGAAPRFGLDPIYFGSDFISETETESDDD